MSATTVNSFPSLNQLELATRVGAGDHRATACWVLLGTDPWHVDQPAEDHSAAAAGVAARCRNSRQPVEKQVESPTNRSIKDAEARHDLCEAGDPTSDPEPTDTRPFVKETPTRSRTTTSAPAASPSRRQRSSSLRIDSRRGLSEPYYPADVIRRGRRRHGAAVDLHPRGRSRRRGETGQLERPRQARRVGHA